MSDSDEANIPDRHTCQKLTEKFAEITGTDEACAQFYLQDRSWDLQRSVNSYFEDNQSNGARPSNGGDEPEVAVNVDEAMLNAYGFGPPTDVPPTKLSLISWNLDGLDDHNLKRRTKAVCKIIYQEKPDIVLLQELIPSTFKYISEKLPEYSCIAGNTEEYFTAVLLRRFTLYYDSHSIIPFSVTQMGRNLIHVKVHVGKVKLNIFNTHLESTAEHSDIRKNQLQKMFEEVNKVSEDQTVLFGGDLNLRDKELHAIGGIPPGVEDLWVTCGSRKECLYTWDTLRNTNKTWPGKFKPRCRFDRAFIRHSHPRSLVPKHFGLVGIQKVISTQSYPSDHWGIQVFFDIEASSSGQ